MDWGRSSNIVRTPVLLSGASVTSATFYFGMLERDVDFTFRFRMLKDETFTDQVASFKVDDLEKWLRSDETAISFIETFMVNIEPGIYTKRLSKMILSFIRRLAEEVPNLHSLRYFAGKAIFEFHENASIIMLVEE